MRVAVVCARYPERGAKGDQQRAFDFVTKLAQDHEVVVVTSASASSAAAAGELEAVAEVACESVGVRGRCLAAIGSLLTGGPAQVGWMTPLRQWRSIERRLVEADVVLAITVRAIRGRTGAPLVLDHVDALSLNMARRAHGSEPLLIRLFARLESRLLERYERRCAGWAFSQVVTSREDADHLPQSPAMTLLPVGFDGDRYDEPAGHERDIDVILTGSMRYPPNRVAAEWLAAEVAPRVRARHPLARISIVGRSADSLQVGGIEIASDVPDLQAYLRRAKVAVVPLRGGTGSPYKVLEAVANGAALVANSWALRPHGIPVPSAETADEFAELIAYYLEDEGARSAAAASALPGLQANSTDALARRLEAVLALAAKRSHS